MPPKRPTASSSASAAKRTARGNGAAAVAHDGTSAAASAAAGSAPVHDDTLHRFFDKPELVLQVVGHLSTERLDLLSLSLVSKKLRAVSLAVWVRNLDLTLSAAPERLRLLQAYPALLPRVRYLRVRNDAAEQGLWGAGPAALRRAARPESWEALNRVLELIAEPGEDAGPALHLPLIDITVSSRDPLQVPDTLKRRVVALRILPFEAPFDSSELMHDGSDNDEGDDDSDDDDFEGSDEDEDEEEEEQDEPGASARQRRQVQSRRAQPPDENSSDDDDDDGDGGDSVINDEFDDTYHMDYGRYQANAEREKQEDMAARSSWDELADIVHKADALRVFHFGVFDASVGGQVGHAYERLWKGLAEKQARALRDLAINLKSHELPKSVFRPSVKFTELSSLDLAGLTDEDEDLEGPRLKMVNDFLGRHAATLEHIHIDAVSEPNTSIGRKHTYPRLRSAHLDWARGPSRQEVLGFADRHPHLLQAAEAGFVPNAAKGSAGSSGARIPYPDLRLVPFVPLLDFKKLVAAGRPLASTSIALEGSPAQAANSLIRALRWFKDNPAAASRLTWLDLVLSDRKTDMRTMFPETKVGEISALLGSDTDGGGALPNLAELSIHLPDPEYSLIPRIPHDDSEDHIGALLGTLCAARKLRVLHINDHARRFRPADRVLLRGRGVRFPPALEYVAWLSPPARVPQYFRFKPAPLPASASSAAAATANGHGANGNANENGGVGVGVGTGKTGPLEAVPTVFRQRIAWDGVWEKPFDGQQTVAVLDHLAGPGPEGFAFS